VSEPEIYFIVRYYGESAIREWFKRCWDLRFAHGSELVDALGKMGRMDNVADAQAFLRTATRQGWIKRGARPTPTREQVFFDVNRSIKLTPDSAWHAYGYEPNYSSVEARAFRSDAELRK
jgi:hypothetical protein